MPKSRSKKLRNTLYNHNKRIRDFNKPVLDWGDYKLTLLLSGILTLIYIISDLLFPGQFFIYTPDEIIELLAQNNVLVLKNGEWYRLITAIFIHNDIFHLGGNLLFLVIFGFRLEEMYGAKTVGIVFLLAGVSGNVLTLIVFGTNNFWSLGASGGVQGIFAATIVFLRKDYPRGSITALSFVGFFFIFTLGSNTNFIGHLGGILGGAAIAFLFESYGQKYKLKG